MVSSIHSLANIVTCPANFSAAVLIRGGGRSDELGQVTKSIGMTGEANRKSVTSACGFFIADALKVKNTRIRRTLRIGIDYAEPIWAQKPYRFLLI